MVASGFLAGLFVPVRLFPDWLRTLAHCTPFPSTLMTPVDVLTGMSTGRDAVVAVLVQLAWLAALAVVGERMTVRGHRHLEIQGG
ncbi:ABC-2 type transport system permease protein [Gordonia amarae]|uniref:ABC transporter permease protein n=1 Tax=Gordonia amarae NBRC 15530 TaxID=1075090 RepID=G7GL52_9ACTN|nr:hypothetical protein [Gordonia amarae]MCS3878853.1 ABC-2 type transport system permease protein [Gordonia amarae]GAB04327.1 hypothetical protein GOAMR_19_00140 [Gordonia amarae NBRC 15530]